MVLGKRIVGFDEDGNPIFKNTSENGKLVGEIVLNKENSICNICLVTGTLTKDHVPPQCMGNKGKFHYINYFNYSLLKSAEYFGIAQNGIQFRTVCAECNNVRLKRFDDEITKMAFQAKEQMDKKRSLNFDVRIKPNMIIRGILGHLLAGQLIEDGSVMDPIFRKAVLNPSDPIDPTIGFYVFPYLHSDVRILRNLAVLSQTGNPVLVNILKIFPFGFLVSDQRKFLTPHWHDYFAMSQEEELEFPMFKIGPSPQGWPEDVPANGIGTLIGKGGAESIIGFREDQNPLDARNNQ